MHHKHVIRRVLLPTSRPGSSLSTKHRIDGIKRGLLPSVLLILAGCSNGPSTGVGANSGGSVNGAGGASASGGTTASGGASAVGGAKTGGAGPSSGGSEASTGGATGGTATGDGGAATGGSVGGTASGGTQASGGSSTGGGSGETFDGKELFLLIGQSNMSGMSPMPSYAWPINERVTFMVQFDCAGLDQTAGEWLPAEPPLHGCQWATGGIGLGLADFFGAKIAEEWPDSKIGLIPNAIPGQVISIYLKEGATEAPIPPGYTDAYDMTVKRSLKAQEQGRIRAILMHQGESDYNKGLGDQWLGKVAKVVADLRADLKLGEEVPFLAGQIGPSQWEGHNQYVDQIPKYVPNSAVISSEGTAIHDVAHFDIPSAKLMGERYVATFLEMVPEP